MNTNLTYQQRVTAIRDTGVGVSSSKLIANLDVFTDDQKDNLNGEADRDWFFATMTGPTTPDLLFGRQLNKDISLIL